MLSLPIGVIGILVICVILILGGDVNPSVFLNTHALVAVVGGTFAVLAIGSPSETIRTFFKMLPLLKARHPAHDPELSQRLVEFAKNPQSTSAESAYALLNYAQELNQQGLDSDTSTLLMFEKMNQINQETGSAVQLLRNLAKFPPALGMTGTVLGLVSLFSKLTADSQNQVGPSLALAMTSTFYGLILANGLLVPLSDRLQMIHEARVRNNKFIFYIFNLIQEGQPATVIREEIYGKSA